MYEHGMANKTGAHYRIIQHQQQQYIIFGNGNGKFIKYLSLYLHSTGIGTVPYHCCLAAASHRRCCTAKMYIIPISVLHLLVIGSFVCQFILFLLVYTTHTHTDTHSFIIGMIFSTFKSVYAELYY